MKFLYWLTQSCQLDKLTEIKISIFFELFENHLFVQMFHDSLKYLSASLLRGKKDCNEF